MSNSGKYHASSRAIILGTTLLLGLVATALIFAPAEVASALGFTGVQALPLVLQLYGAALFGLAMTGWMIRGAIVGGIFGRSYVAGNAAHATIGAFALVRVAVAPGAPAALVALCVAYCALAVVFGYLMFASTPSA